MPVKYSEVCDSGLKESLGVSDMEARNSRSFIDDELSAHYAHCQSYNYRAALDALNGYVTLWDVGNVFLRFAQFDDIIPYDVP